jgi:hypothetical protein
MIYNIGGQSMSETKMFELCMRYKRALEGLTPGGSEFVNDPERCAEFVRDKHTRMHHMLVLARQALHPSNYDQGEAVVQAQSVSLPCLDCGRSHPQTEECIRPAVGSVMCRSCYKATLYYADGPMPKRCYFCGSDEVKKEEGK